MDRPISLPTWLRELDGSLAVNSQFVLWGNVHDRYLIPGDLGPTMVDMESAIWSLLADDYDAMVVFDPIVGVHTVPADLPDDSPVRTRLDVLLQAIPSVGDSFGTSQPDSAAAQPDERVRSGQPRPDQLVDLIGALTALDPSPAAPRVVTLVPYASRLVVDSTRLTAAEHRFFASLYRLSRASRVVSARVIAASTTLSSGWRTANVTSRCGSPRRMKPSGPFRCRARTSGEEPSPRQCSPQLSRVPIRTASLPGWPT